MRRVVFMIDGWFMRKRIYKLKTFYYSGPEIRRYCLKHLREGDYLYRIFYYDTAPLEKKGTILYQKERLISAKLVSPEPKISYSNQ